MASLKFIEPMYARAVEKLPEGRDWVYEIKLDGYRCLAGRDTKRVTLWSRRAMYLQTSSQGSLEFIPPAEREAIIHRAVVAARRDAFKLIKAGRKDESKPATLKGEFR